MTPAADGASTPSTTETGQPPSAGARVERRSAVVRVIVVLLLVLLLGVALTLVEISSQATMRPQKMPFGVTGSSSVVTAAQSAKFSGYRMSFVNRLYANESDARHAINQGTIYGAYITGNASDTLLVVPSKSFFASIVIASTFEGTAKKLGRPLAVQQVKPLPAGKDPTGAVAGLLLLPLIVGGLLSAILVYKATGAEAQHWRVAILCGYALVGAVLTLVIAGPVFGAFAGDRFWPLLPCAVLMEITVALVTAMLIAVLPGLVAMLLALVLFIVVGLITAGTSGTAMMPPYWQAIGGALPPRYGADLIQNVLYFSSNNIGTAIVVLAVYALIAGVILSSLGWLRPRRPSAPAGQGDASGKGGSRSRLAVRIVLAALVITAVQQSLFASNYISSGHNPVARDMPVAVVGKSSLTGAVPKGWFKFTSYPTESAARNAIDKAKAWGALIPGSSASRLLVVPSISDLAPLPLAAEFEKAAKSQGQKLTVSAYTPKPLASGDPYALVLSMLITPLLLCGYMSATMLRAARGGVAAERYRGLVLVAFAVVLALVVDLIACVWLNGIPSDKFWIVWAILTLIVAVVALFAAVLQRLLGAVGTLLAVIIIILFGKPSAGGANGVPFLPGFWTTIGPFLPPRNAYILLRNTVYFDGNGTAQALIILLAYLVVFAVIIGILDWRRRPDREIPNITRETEAEAAVAATPAGVAI